jgi:hypothetical protein
MPMISLYSSEKHAKTGNGCKNIFIKKGDIKEGETFETVKERMREEQKEENRLYKMVRDKIKDDAEFRVSESKKKNTVFDYNKILPLEEIDPKEIDFIVWDSGPNSGNSLLLVGSSKAGKSTALMALFNRYFNTKKYISTLFSINSHIPIYKNNGDLIKINKFNKESEKMIKDMKKINMNTEPPNKWRFCVLLDDIITARYSGVINALLLAFRNSNFSSIISIQYPKLISKAARCSANNLLFFSQNLQEAIETVLRSFLGAEFAKRGVTKFIDQVTAYRELTKDHAFIYFHPMSGTLRRIRLKI